MSSRLQVQVVTMGQKDFSLLEKMNIQCDALIGNQGMMDNSVSETQYRGHNVVMYSWRETGVGLNRNNLLMRSNAEIVLFSDDDVVYDDGYVDTILDAFDRHPEADGVFFDIFHQLAHADPRPNGSWHRARLYNSMHYATPRLALRGKAIREANICFSLQFGGGAKYACGEDSLFVAQLLRAGLRLYACPARIGVLTEERESTCFTGYTEQFLRDVGVFYYVLTHRFAKLLCFRYCVKNRDAFRNMCSWRTALSLMMQGIRQYREEP